MFIHSWRWFGPGDAITLEQVRQTGAAGIVTALHQVPVGEVWQREEIARRKDMIRSAGFTWNVVESVPLHEDIKLRTGNYVDRIRNYKTTLRNLGKEGVGTVCYNFMPALDWSRTRLAIRNPDGSESSGFDFTEFAAIDIHFLERPDAGDSYPEDTRVKAGIYYNGLDGASRKQLQEAFLLGFPGSGEALTLKEVRHRIGAYNGMTGQDYRSNLKDFVREILPVAEEEGIRLAIHPDDPSFPLLGLPRAVSTLEDALEIIGTADTPANGITFCTGAFGSAFTNDLPRMAEELSHRINFLHVRNVVRDEGNNFRESNLLEGDADIPRILGIMVREDIRRSRERENHEGIPLRPDHGARILGDYTRSYYPGYTLYGRLKNLAEIRGLEAGIRRFLDAGS